MHDVQRIFFIAVSAGLAFVLISLVLRAILLRVNPNLQISRMIRMHDVGAWIGLNEFILVLIFVFINEYTAIAIIFAAKEIVRSEEIRKEPSYYLLGTLLNVVLSLLAAMAIKAITARLFDYPAPLA